MIYWDKIASMYLCPELSFSLCDCLCRSDFMSKDRRTAMMTYLLEHSHCNPNHPEKNGATPLDMVREPEHIRLLLKFGASPKESHLHKGLPEQLWSQPADMSINMFVLGNPGAGKSTLVKSFQTEGDRLSRIKYRFTRVTDVDASTAGIIPYDICSKALGRMTLYDFAGHKEFYAGHDALLQNSMTSSPSIIALVIDMRGEERQIRKTLHYWFEFINNHSSKGRSESHLVIIGSHSDNLSSKEAKQKSLFLQSITKHHNLDNISIAGQIMIDCRYAESSSMSQLRSVISQSCQALQSLEKMAIAHHAFQLFLFDKFGDEAAVSYNVAATEMMRCVDSEHYCYLQCVKSSGLIEVCEALNKRGNILFMKNNEHPENSWIVLDKGVLLAKVNGIIFAPKGFKEHQNLSTSTGVVPLSKLASHFPELDSNMISQFLCHLEFCHEITDPEILVLLQASTSDSCSDEKFFFFPSLVDLNIPSNVWLPNSQFAYYSGWLLQCRIRQQFLSARFLQVLLHRLAYGVAFLPSEHKSSCDVTTIQRSCCVWKCGIAWSDQSGIETLIEIVDQRSVVVIIRSLKQIESQTLLTTIRSQIIRRVLDTKDEMCPKVVTTESLVHPDDVLHYPLDLTKVRRIEMPKISHAVVEAKAGVMDSSEQMVDLKGSLLYFEPYLGMDKSTLSELFQENSHIPAEDAFLYDIAKCMHKNIDFVIELFKPCPIRLANLQDRAPPGDVHKLVRVLQLWREEMGVEGTRDNLRKKLDQCSVFVGRNPVDLCPQ